MSRRGIAVTLVLLPAAMFASATVLAQRQTEVARLDIALAQNYRRGETVFVTYRITNSSSSLLCFPPPAVDCYSIEGELAASATPPKGVSVPNISGVCAADRLILGDVGSDIDKNWVKLGPLQSYEITKASKFIYLSGAGQWSIEAGYVPMREDALSPFSNALKERGCRLLPELHSKKAEISVRAPAP